MKIVPYRLFIVGLLLLTVAVGLMTHDAPDADRSLLPPSLPAWLGTDRLGRDYLARTARAVLASMMDAAPATAASVAVALIVGALCWWLRIRRRWIARMIDSVLLALSSIPPLLLAAVTAVIFRDWALTPILVLFAFSVCYAIPVFEAEIRSVMRQPYIEGGFTLGVEPLDLLRRYIWPEMAPRLKRLALLELGSLVAFSALLGMVGIVSPDRPNLGKLIFDASPYLFSHSWLFLAPFSALVLVLWVIWPGSGNVLEQSSYEC